MFTLIITTIRYTRYWQQQTNGDTEGNLYSRYSCRWNKWNKYLCLVTDHELFTCHSLIHSQLSRFTRIYLTVTLTRVTSLSSWELLKVVELLPTSFYCLSLVSLPPVWFFRLSSHPSNPSPSVVILYDVFLDFPTLNPFCDNLNQKPRLFFPSTSFL